MTSTTVRITDEMRATLRQLAEEERETMQAILAWALERYRRERMFERADEIYAAMTPEEWAEEEAERALWDTTLGKCFAAYYGIDRRPFANAARSPVRRG